MLNNDPALVYVDQEHDPGAPGTHVLIIGVGKYEFGKGAKEAPVAADLRQLTSPPISARAIADWSIQSFANQQKPLASVALLISEDPVQTYQPPSPAGVNAHNVPAASLQNVKDAAAKWAARAGSNLNNLAVFYFCGHGASSGQTAALLLSDFGKPTADYEGAIELSTLLGTMKNSPAIQQAFFLDCCRTHSDDLYMHESTIGSRIVSIPGVSRGHQAPAQQFVLFPAIDGEQAFGIPNRVSAFTSSILDAVQFAAADYSTGTWKTTTADILSHVNRLVEHRVPAAQLLRSKPTALDSSSFDFNEIPEPVPTRSVITLSDLSVWGNVELSAAEVAGHTPPLKKHTKSLVPETCCIFDISEGSWRFSGALPQSPPTIGAEERTVRTPVAYVKLQVTP